MNRPNLKIASLVSALLLTIVLVSIAAKPGPASQPVPAPQQQSPDPKITWSVPQLSETLFPGTSKTVTVRFRSTENLGAVAVWATPSLDGVVSANPTTFSSILANRDYEITLKLSAP